VNEINENRIYLKKLPIDSPLVLAVFTMPLRTVFRYARAAQDNFAQFCSFHGPFTRIAVVNRYDITLFALWTSETFFNFHRWFYALSPFIVA